MGVLVRAVIGQRERHRIAFMNLEARQRPHVPAMERHRRVQLDRIGPCNRAQPVIAPAHPGNDLPIGEAQHQLHVEGHATFDAAHDAHQVDLLLVVGQRHEVDQHRLGTLGLEAGLEDRGAGEVASRDAAGASSDCRGAISHRPFSGVPSSAAKQAGESKRGRQSQSIEPSRPTKAAVTRLPIRP